jgi:hypothetical protein
VPRESGGAWTTLRQLAAKFGEGKRLATLYLGKTLLQCREGIWIRKNLGGLLQRLVLVYRHQRSCGSAVPGYQYVIATVADIIEQSAEIVAEFPNRDDPSHRTECTQLCTLN